ncbi:hypothetical protein BVRB_9g216140 [Beta vulgaris subsp. vulgaris]|nr:hypothetical protein BVRB_9g216140 [Beta vulgaris subsp. vulgaris]
MFNVGMAAATKASIDAVIQGYKDEFSKLEGSLVDVAGGLGKLIAKIVQTYPNIKGINFDQPHAIANAPQYPGVTHVGGDMLVDIPSADNVIIKSVLLDWVDEDCKKILRNCQKAVSQKKGKIIIVDIILHPDRHEMMDDAAMDLDLLMMTNYGGKGRTEDEWNKLLNEAGFTDFNIIPLQDLMSLIIINC